jgi:sensor histidine kinase regulating citrate/malate metabolism
MGISALSSIRTVAAAPSIRNALVNKAAEQDIAVAVEAKELELLEAIVVGRAHIQRCSRKHDGRWQK